VLAKTNKLTEVCENINIVYLLHVQASHVAILGEVHTKDWYIEILQKFVNQCTYVKLLSFKNAWFKP